MFDNNFYSLSLYKANSNLLRLQRRILKAVYVGDFFYVVKLQKLLLISNSARLLAIKRVFSNLNDRDSLNLNFDPSFSSLDKFKMSVFILNNLYNWNPQCYKDVLVGNEFQSYNTRVRVWSIYDQCWQCLVKFAIEPVTKFLSSPKSFDINNLQSFSNLQKTLSLNLSKESYAFQKRILLVSCSSTLMTFDFKFLLKKVLAPRSIKLGIFRFLKIGLILNLDSKLSRSNFLDFILLQSLFGTVDSIVNNLRVGSTMMIFLKPLEDEVKIIQKLTESFALVGINKSLFTFRFVSLLSGFDFLDWHYRFYSNKGLCCVANLMLFL